MATGAMMATIQGGSVEAAKLVLANGGGNMTDRDNNGWTVMMHAAYSGSIEAMRLLLANGGNMTDKRDDGYTVMMAAAYGGSIDAVKLALANGGDMTDKCNDGYCKEISVGDFWWFPFQRYPTPPSLLVTS